MPAIVIDGISREVAFERVTDGFVVVVDGRRHEVRNVSANAGMLEFFVGHTSHEAHVSRAPTGVILSIDGRTGTVARGNVDADRPTAAGGHSGNGTLEAPMPGSIVAVHVTKGDHVKFGQAVVVLESMKMHNEIVSPMDGVVRRVNCKAGEQVAYGRVLVEIGAETP